MLLPSISGAKKPFLLFSLLVPAALNVFAASQSAAPIDAIFTPKIDSRTPGAAALVRKNGHTVFMRTYGVTDLNTFAKIDARTNFRLASFTKQFTAMAIMLLVHDGKLRYDQNLTELFPGFPDYGRAITVRHLLTHTSGLPDYEELMEQKEKANGAPLWSSTKQIHDDEVLALLAEQAKGVFEPGTSWSYSNSGYVVLGLIVAKVSGMPYADFLRKRIFAPLKMSQTVVYMDGVNTVKHRAYGFSKKNGHLVPTDQSATSATLGDGAIYSNLVDLARWDDALKSNRLLPQAEMARAFEPVKLNNGNLPVDDSTPAKPVSYGFGWFLRPIDGHPCTWHTGSTSGFRTVIERFSDTGLTIIILLNRTDLDAAELATEVLRADTGMNAPAKGKRAKRSAQN